MEKHIYNEQTGISYTLHGDYYLPDLTLSDDEKGAEIGVYGQRHLRYIKQHKKALYLTLLTTGKLNDYLADIDKQAEEMLFRLVKQMAECEGVTEQLKTDNQMEWVIQMNNIRFKAIETINKELIYE